MNEELLSIPQVKQILKIGTTKTYALINEGKLKAVKLGGKTLFCRSTVNDFIQSLPSKAAT